MNFFKRFQSTATGSTIGGRYKLVDQLGVGGFGQTFLAEDLHLPGHPRCVVKQLKPQVEDERHLRTARRLFETEAKVLYQLGDHDQIPRLLAHFMDGEEFYLVQELIEGEPLTKKFASGFPWTEKRVMELLHDLMTVLEFVHSKNVIHRDIKPSNLICRPDGKIVLIDFGAVKQVGQSSDAKGGQTQTVSVGTQGYMPAEQLGGHPRFSSDIYAAGMVGIQALTGTHPKHLHHHPRTGELDWRNHRIDGRSLPALRTSSELANILDRMVFYHFKDRYQTAAEVRQDLSKLMAQQLEQPEDEMLTATSDTVFLPALSQPSSPSGAPSQVEPTEVEGTAIEGTYLFSESRPTPHIRLESAAPELEDLSESSITDLLSEPPGTDSSSEKMALTPSPEPIALPPLQGEVLSESWKPVHETDADELFRVDGSSEVDSSPETDSSQVGGFQTDGTLSEAETVVQKPIAESAVDEGTDLEWPLTEPSVEQPLEHPSHVHLTEIAVDPGTFPPSSLPLRHNRSQLSALPPTMLTDGTVSASGLEAETAHRSIPETVVLNPHPSMPPAQVAPSTQSRSLSQRESDRAALSLSQPGWFLAFGIGALGVALVSFTTIAVLSNFANPELRLARTLETLPEAQDLPCDEPFIPPELPDTPDYIFPNGTQYYGATANNQPTDGQVTMLFPTGDRYDGEFRQGQRNGCGVYTNANGRQYIGEFQSDQFQGQGTWILENGDRYIGTFQNNRCHGEGVFVFADGRVQRGTWQDGNLVGGDLSCTPSQ